MENEPATRTSNMALLAELLRRLTTFGAAPIFVCGLVLAYFCQPLLAFADHSRSYTGAVIFVVGVLAVTICRQVSTWFWGELLGSIVVFLSILVFQGAMDEAFLAFRKNDSRCWVIEKAMMTGSSERDDLPDIFSALSCRPQTGDAIRLSKPT